jgi:hypothetical protein
MYKAIKYIVFSIFLLNSFFGYAWTNVRLGGIPLNEIGLMVGLFCAIPFLLPVVKQNPVIKPLLLWSILFMPFALYGFSVYGFFALRDASHLIEIWWIPLAIIAFSDINEQKLHRILKICMMLYIIRSGIQLLLTTSHFVIPGLHAEVALFSRSYMFIIGIVCFWGLPVKLHKNYVVFALYLLSILIGQSRGEIATIGVIGMVYLLIMRMSATAVRRFVFFMAVLIGGYAMLVNSGSIENLAGKSKFGKVLSVSDYADLILSSTGKSKKFEGSAEGIPLRLEWAEKIFQKAEDDISVLLLGQGFGMPLTDFVAPNSATVREPHNSFLTVFARTGIIGFIIWGIFHIRINAGLFRFFRKNTALIRNNYTAKFLLCCFFAIIGNYVIALVESPFEAPYLAIPVFITIGVMVSLYKTDKSRLREK